jgi:hypothetical protein
VVCGSTNLKDWHPDTGLTHEQWWAGLLAQGWELGYPGLEEGTVFELNGRTVRRHSIKRYHHTERCA